MPNLSKSDMDSALRRAGLPMLPGNVCIGYKHAEHVTTGCASGPIGKSAAEAPDDKAITKKPPKGKSEQTVFLSDSMIGLLSQQVGNEVFASYSYHGASYWFDKRGFDGFTKYMKAQGMDEIKHAEKIFEHMVDANAPFQLPGISAPFMEYESVEEVCKAILEHEKSVTASWRKIAELAIRDKDAATMQLSQIFLVEQMEEERKSSTLYDRVRMATSDGLLTIDAQLMGK